MLSKPEYGWTTVSLGERADRASYLTDVPMDILDGFINNKENDFYLSFDAEGWEFEIVVRNNNANMIKYKDTDDITVFAAVPITKEELALEVANDIEKDIEAWTIWFVPECKNSNDEILVKRKARLLKKIQTIKELYLKGE